jgi:chemotaxis response regulator CheB
MSFGRILVVDDFVPWQNFVLGLLESETDLQILSTAVEGTEAVQRALQLQPDFDFDGSGLARDERH